MMEKKHDEQEFIHPLDILRQAGIVGGFAAVPGTLSGAIYGTLRTKTPILFAIISGAQWFGIGSTFYTARTSILNYDGLTNWWNATRGVPIKPRSDLDPTSSNKVKASAMAGAFTGFSLGFLYRGPQNVIPGTIMFTLFFSAAQGGYNYLDARNSDRLRERVLTKQVEEATPRETMMDRFAKSKWSPLNVLSDEQYDNMLQERLLKVDVEIALIDDKIAALRQQAQEAKLREKTTQEPQA